MTTTDVTSQDAIKAPLAWSAIAVVAGGYLWALLYEKGFTLWGFLAFVVAVVVLALGLRKLVTIVPVLTLVALVAASVIVGVTL